ncbi:AgmX/PglI C-terminal domain-containing protein [Haliangium ochraceum]|uniref:TonB family protein n=1 Tax=Haliangium ochraceum (strain DSM 14365 / JCM 11303 / SMP-2) TaxID=502025 RepID=D0LN76_HALO1|nr:AgmX/PglI C-terminal domain-containing protein [Haliangium ochraceum]ACY15253.1 hypothetical protein Hoch_2724 [Haliangium ochraceum DSM 14365]
MSSTSSLAPSAPPLSASASASATAATAHTAVATAAREHLEVVTLLGSSVVDVAYLEPAAPAAARRRHITMMVMAAGALLLALAGVAFARGLALAAVNEQALAAWMAAGDAPIYAFRPQRLHPIFDVLLFGALPGLLLLSWGLWRTRRAPVREQFTLGSAPDSDLSIAPPRGVALPTRFALARWQGDRPTVRIPRGARATLQRDGRADDIDTLAQLGTGRVSVDSAAGDIRCVELAAGESVRVELGRVALVLRRVPARRARSLRGALLPERRTTAFVLATAAAHLLLVLVLQSLPPAPYVLGLGPGIGPGTRITRIQRLADEQPPAPRTSGSEQTAMALPAPAAPGERLHRDSSGDNRPQRVSDRPPLGSRGSAEARAQARREGMLAFFQAQPSALDQLTSIGSLDAEVGVIDAYGTPEGMLGGATWGSFGSGPSGLGAGGTPFGGPGGTIGMGGFDTGTSKENNSYASCGGCGGFSRSGSGHITRVPQVKTCSGDECKADGALDKSIIRSRIQRQHERVRHCYERALLSAPALAGTLAVDFLISPEGAVLSVNTGGMQHAELNACVAGVVENIEFPRATTGGLTKVSYPFTFQPAGE